MMPVPYENATSAMKAITIIQPWASLVADGRKRYETRSWPPPRALVGQRIAIHAGAKRSREQSDAAYRFGMTDLPLGVVVCTARLVAAHHIRTPFGLSWAVSEDDGFATCSDPDYRKGARIFPVDSYGDYSAGRWAWRLLDIEVLEQPVPATGRQGFWEWNP